jgi:outer membrane protein
MRTRLASLALLLGGSALVPACVTLPWRSYATAPPSASQTWRAPAPGAVRAPPPPPSFAPDHEYALVELVDLAQRLNPETRQAWEAARAAAARLGSAEAIYLPSLALAVRGGFEQTPYPAPGGHFATSGPFFEPKLDLAWTLLDLDGFAAVGEAHARVLELDFAFDRKHEEVLFEVARAFYTLDATRARVAAAQATLRSAAAVEEAAAARLANGLATRPELLLAQQEHARASYELAAADGDVRTAQAALAQSVGVPPMPVLRVISLAAQPLPPQLATSVERLMEAALALRPDLAAGAAAVKASRAGVRRAQGAFAPRLSLDVSAGYRIDDYSISPQGGRFSFVEPLVDAHLDLHWSVFAGFAHWNELHRAEAEHAGSEAALSALALRALRDTWDAYFAVKTAETKVQFADALLRASEEAYAAVLETYRHGLGTLIDLLTAERDLAQARDTDIESRAELRISAAALTLATGALPAGAR